MLSMIGLEVGRLLYTDKLTRTRERLAYARLLVEVDIEGTKVDTVPIQLPTSAQLDLMIHYEETSQYCADCHRIGHQQGACKNKDDRTDKDATPQGLRGCALDTLDQLDADTNPSRGSRAEQLACKWQMADGRANPAQERPATVGDQTLMLIETPTPIVVCAHPTLSQ